MFRVDRAALDMLLEEIRRYLEAVEVFRREGREPRWNDVPLADPAR